MDRQVNDMLTFVKGEQGLKKTLINVSNFIPALKKSLFLIQQVQKKTNIEWDCRIEKPHSLIFLGSEDELLGAIDNLIHNAIDACHQNQLIHIKLNTQQTNKQLWLLIHVIDSGIGMNESEQKHLFEPFYTTKKQGNGLGLSIVRRIILEHSGHIQVNSTHKQGTHIQLKIPVHCHLFNESISSSKENNQRSNLKDTLCAQ
jgi:signal transduction histidine kinase